MERELENSEWIELAPSLAKMSKRNPFGTPENYFTELEDHAQVNVFLAELPRNTNNYGLNVPEDYFTTLASNIETTIKLSQAIKPQSSFEVPKNYFSELQEKLEARTSEFKPEVKPRVIKLWRTNLIKYATAACLLLVSSFGIYYYNQQPVKSNAETSEQAEMANEQMLYNIDEGTIIQHIDSENAIEDKNVSTKDTEVETYLLNHYTANELAQDL